MMRSRIMARLKQWPLAFGITLVILLGWLSLYGELESLRTWRFLLVPLVLGTCAIRVVLWFFNALADTWRPLPEDDFSGAGESGAVQRVIVQLRLRASKMRIVAAFTLFLILIFLAGGLYVFSQAESVASSAEGQRVVTELGALSEAIISQKSKARELVAQYEQEKDPVKKDALKALVLRAQNLVDDYNDRSKMLAATAPQATTGEKSQTAYVLTVLSTKVGSALMLLFLIQILVSLYRYNTKVASFYDGRADALQLVALDDIDILSAVSSILSTDKLDFGKMPATPMQHALEITKELLSAKAKII